MEFPEPLEAWPNPHPHPGALVSQEETNSLVKVKSYIFACKLTTSACSLGLQAGAPKNCSLKSHPWGGPLPGTLFPTETPDCWYWDLPALFKFGCRLSTQFGDVYAIIPLYCFCFFAFNNCLIVCV